MDVAEASFNEIISQARTQFVVPIWQRLYSWEWKEWNDLWDDLMNLYERMSINTMLEISGTLINYSKSGLAC